MANDISVSEFAGGNFERTHGLRVLVGPETTELTYKSYTTTIRISGDSFDPISENDQLAITESLRTDADFRRTLGSSSAYDQMEFHLNEQPNHRHTVMAIELAKHVMSALSLPGMRVISFVDELQAPKHYLLVTNEAD